MTSLPEDSIWPEPSVQAHLLGLIDFSRCLALQERLVADTLRRGDGQITVLVCEHPTVITVGREGSLTDIELEAGLLRHRRVEVEWVKRGGGTILHTPGQIAVYPIVPLEWHGWSIGHYLSRLHECLAESLAALNVPVQGGQASFTLLGRAGQLSAGGIAVRRGISWHGFHVNVAPAMGLFHLVRKHGGRSERMSSIALERARPVRLATVRSELVRRVSEAFGCQRYHLHTGHPWLAAPRPAVDRRST